MKLFVVPALLLTALSFSGVAAAQISQTATPYELVRQGGDPTVSDSSSPTYTVTFKDDAVAAALEDGSIPQIRVRAVKGYGQLARPRLHFVTEMLKSVEVM